MTLPTARDHDSPTVTQFSVFLENRVGQLLDLIRIFEGSDIRIFALSVVDSVDCAVVRMVFNDVSKARQIIRDHHFSFSESELVAVELPGPRALLKVCSALLAAEINIHYVYPLMPADPSRRILGLHVDDCETAVEVLTERDIRVVTQGQLSDSHQG